MTQNHKTIQSLLETCAKVADVLGDGHMTIYKFTAGWKVVLGTPGMSLSERNDLWNRQPPDMDLDEALVFFLRDPQRSSA